MDAPKTKTEWIKVLKRLGLNRYTKGPDGWLEYLPAGQKIKAVPLVLVELDKVDALMVELAKEKLSLQWSTIFFNSMYFDQKKFTVKTLTRPPDRWWDSHELIDGKYISKETKRPPGWC